MKNSALFGCFLLLLLLPFAVFGQQMTVINDPLDESFGAALSATDENLIKSSVLPKVRAHWAEAIEQGICTEEFEGGGAVKGAFTKAKTEQKLIAFQFCQTGNGLANNALVLIENGKIGKTYVSEGGWLQRLKVLPDINQNGLNEFAVYYSGGIHQGAGGTGVDLWEFSAAANLKPLGWFQASNFDENDDNYDYKVSVAPGKKPVFYREKYVPAANNKLRKSGKIAKFAPGENACPFTELK